MVQTFLMIGGIDILWACSNPDLYHPDESINFLLRSVHTTAYYCPGPDYSHC